MKLDNSNKLRFGIILAILIFYAKITFVILKIIIDFMMIHHCKHFQMCHFIFFAKLLLIVELTANIWLCDMLMQKKNILLSKTLNFFSQNILRYSYISFCVKES